MRKSDALKDTKELREFFASVETTCKLTEKTRVEWLASDVWGGPEHLREGLLNLLDFFDRHAAEEDVPDHRGFISDLVGNCLDAHFQNKRLLQYGGAAHDIAIKYAAWFTCLEMDFMPLKKEQKALDKKIAVISKEMGDWNL